MTQYVVYLKKKKRKLFTQILKIKLPPCCVSHVLISYAEHICPVVLCSSGGEISDQTLHLGV